MAEVIVIGAGMAGVSAARELSGRGHVVTVLEARDRVGGRVWSVRDLVDRPVEAGAEFVHGSGAATWPDVLAAGFDTRPCPLMRHTMFDVGHGTRWLPLIVAHPEVWRTYPILASLERQKPPDHSAREYIERRCFRGRGRVLAEMVLTAHLPGSIDEVGVLGLKHDGVLKLESGLNHRLEDGYDRLPAFVLEGHDERPHRVSVEHGFEVEEIRWRPDGVEVRAADGRERSAAAAVCTLPVGVLKRGGLRFDPPLPASKTAALEKIVMGPVLKVLLRFRERFWPRWLANLGCGVGPVTLYWPVFYGDDRGPPVLIAYATGPRAAALGKLGEQEATKVCLDDLARLFPKVDPAPLLEDSRRIDWAKDPYALGGYTFLRPGGVGARADLAAPDTGALFWAGSSTESTPIAACVEAAFLSGRRAAGELDAQLAERSVS